ncbi:MAG: HAD hydrolase-like protein [Candidatus Shapirobacteria bacterium]
MLKKVVFDFDGTLADTFEQMMTLIRGIRPELGDREVKLYKEKGARVFVDEFKIPLVEIIGMVMKIQKQQNKIINQAAGFKGIKKLIEELKRNKIEVGILTSNSKKNVEKWLKEKDIEVDWVQSESTIFGKEKAIARVKTSDMVYVGDEVRDIEACKKIEVKIVAVSWGYNTKQALVNAGADYVVDDVVELRNLFLIFNQ